MSSRNLKIIILTLVALLFVGFHAPASVLVGFLQSRIDPDLQYSHIEGRLWSGRIENVSISQNYLGRIDYKLSILPFLRGRAHLNLTFSGGAINGNGIFVLGKNYYEARNSSFKLQLAQLHGLRAFGEPLVGTADIQVNFLKMNDNGCVNANGEVSSDFIKLLARQLREDGFLLAGPVTCQDDKLALTLEGQAGEDTVKLAFLLNQNLSYQVQADVVVASQDVIAALQIAGFEKRENGLRLQSQGILRE